MLPLAEIDSIVVVAETVLRAKSSKILHALPKWSILNIFFGHINGKSVGN